MHEWRTDMVTENIKKQLADFKKQGKSLAFDELMTALKEKGYFPKSNTSTVKLYIA